MTPEWIVAGAEISMACATVFLGLQARNEAREVGEQVKIERRQLEAEARPYVVPAPDSKWLGAWPPYAGVEQRRLIPVKNTGPGTALNVDGALDFGSPTGLKVSIMRTSLAPNDREHLLVQWGGEPRRIEDWVNVAGRLDYEDVNGGRWRTNFSIYAENERLHIHVRDVEQTMLPDGTPMVGGLPIRRSARIRDTAAEPSRSDNGNRRSPGRRSRSRR